MKQVTATRLFYDIENDHAERNAGDSWQTSDERAEYLASNGYVTYEDSNDTEKRKGQSDKPAPSKRGKGKADQPKG